MKLQLKHKLVVGTSIGIVCLVLLVASRYSNQKSPTMAMPIPEVEVVTVEQKDIPKMNTVRILGLRSSQYHSIITKHFHVRCLFAIQRHDVERVGQTAAGLAVKLHVEGTMEIPTKREPGESFIGHPVPWCWKRP